MIYYIVFSYLITLGICIKSEYDIGGKTMAFILSPIYLPIAIGAFIAKKYDN
jgi:hypothetical protein